MAWIIDPENSITDRIQWIKDGKRQTLGKCFEIRGCW